MNKEYIQSGYNFIISTDKGLKKVDLVNNMKEILETENNIEEIEDLKKQNYKDELFSYKNILDYLQNTFYKKSFSIAIPIVIIISLVTAIITNIDLAITTLLISLCGTGIITGLISFINIPKCNKLYKNICKSTDELLTNELDNQKGKLKELEKESKILASNDLGITDQTIKINGTKLISDLKRKLELIEDYQFMKKDLIEYSKDHFISPKLRDMGYSKSDANFICQLVENDKKEENEIHKSLIKK